MSAPARPDVVEQQAATRQAAFAALMVEELVRLGVRRFYIAPGSRSTPLVAAIARNARAVAEVFVDERVAAFAALGFGRAGGPHAGAKGGFAAVVTTSGSAVGHALPAVIEADADGVPLLVISADRPPELQGCGANQTIDQQRIFGDRVRNFTSLPVPTAELPASWWLSTLDEAVAHATGANAGPVHINVAFRKPLEPVDGDLATLVAAIGQGDAAKGRSELAVDTSAAALAIWLAGVAPWRTIHVTPPRFDASDHKTIGQLEALLQGDGVVVVGGMHDGAVDAAAERDAIAQFARLLGWPVLYDIVSGFALDAAAAGAVVGYERILRSPGARALLQPPTVIELGGHVVSAALAAWIAASGATRVAIRPASRRRDPDHQISLDLRATVASVVAVLIARRGAVAPAPPSRLAATFAQLSAALVAVESEEERASSALDGAGAVDAIADEIEVVRAVAAALPAGAAWMIASSMPIRDANGWTSPRPAPPRIFANRGASGIDGLVATAMGIAAAHDGPTTLLLGDLALQHDLGGLFALGGTDLPLTVVCIDNGGGGIFHFLPVAAHADLFERYVAAGHQRDLAAAARGFGLEVHDVMTRSALTAALSHDGRPSRPRVVVVHTDRARNHQRHVARFAAAVAAVERACAGVAGLALLCLALALAVGCSTNADVSDPDAMVHSDGVSDGGGGDQEADDAGAVNDIAADDGGVNDIAADDIAANDIAADDAGAVLFDGSVSIDANSGVSATFAVVIPVGTRAFAVNVVGVAGVRYALDRVVDPAGTVLATPGWIESDPGATTQCLQCPLRLMSQVGAVAALVPNAPAITAVPGAWQLAVRAFQFADAGPLSPPIYQAVGGEVTVVVVRAQGPDPVAHSVLDLNFFFSGADGLTATTAKTDATVAGWLTVLQQRLAQVGVQIGAVRYLAIDPGLQVVEVGDAAEADFTALGAATHDALPGLNVVFVREIVSPNGGLGAVLGVAGGIPGPVAMPGSPRSLVLISTADLPSAANAPPQKHDVGTTLAHECGHYLGLFHSSEPTFNGALAAVYDPLPDTADDDVDNLMHYTPFVGAGTLSPQQGDVLRANPTLQPVASAP